MAFNCTFKWFTFCGFDSSSITTNWNCMQLCRL